MRKAKVGTIPDHIEPLGASRGECRAAGPVAVTRHRRAQAQLARPLDHVTTPGASCHIEGPEVSQGLKALGSSLDAQGGIVIP